MLVMCYFNNCTKQKGCHLPCSFLQFGKLIYTINQPNVNDEEFTPTGSMKWTGMKYKNKLKNLAYAISQLATDGPFPCPNGPAFIGISEIENRGE